MHNDRARSPRRRPARIARGLALAMLTALTACRDSARATVASPALEPSASTLSLLAERVAGNDSTYVVTVQLQSADTSSAAARRIGSLTATIDFDTTRVRFLADVSPASSSMRATAVERGRVRVAAASASGLDVVAMAKLTFVTRDSAAMSGLQLGIIELHALDATDLRRALAVRPVRFAPARVAP